MRAGPAATRRPGYARRPTTTRRPAAPARRGAGHARRPSATGDRRSTATWRPAVHRDMETGGPPRHGDRARAAAHATRRPGTRASPRDVEAGHARRPSATRRPRRPAGLPRTANGATSLSLPPRSSPRFGTARVRGTPRSPMTLRGYRFTLRTCHVKVFREISGASRSISAPHAAPPLPARAWRRGGEPPQSRPRRRTNHRGTGRDDARTTAEPAQGDARTADDPVRPQQTNHRRTALSRSSEPPADRPSRSSEPPADRPAAARAPVGSEAPTSRLKAAGRGTVSPAPRRRRACPGPRPSAAPRRPGRRPPCPAAGSPGSRAPHRRGRRRSRPG